MLYGAAVTIEKEETCQVVDDLEEFFHCHGHQGSTLIGLDNVIPPLEWRLRNNLSQHAERVNLN